MPHSVAGRARVGRPGNGLNFQNRRENPRAAEVSPRAKRDKGHPCTAGAWAGTRYPGSLQTPLTLAAPGCAAPGGHSTGTPPL